MRPALHHPLATIGLVAGSLLSGGTLHAEPDGMIGANYGTQFGRAVVGSFPGYPDVVPALRAMVLSNTGRTWLIGSDYLGLEDDRLFVARLTTDNGLADASFGGGDGLEDSLYPPGFKANYIDGAVLQGDGKPVFFGRMFKSLNPGYEYGGLVCRLNVAGNFDATFGAGGCRYIGNIAAHGEECAIRDLAIDPANGSMTAVGECRNGQAGSTNPVFVARLTSAGNFDPEFTFGGVGKPAVPTGQIININALQLQQDGRFIATASIAGVDGDYDIGLLQFSNDGTLDPTWGSGGVVRLALDLAENQHDLGLDIALRPDGRALIAGLADGPGYEDQLVLAQFDSDGELDPTFGNNGISYGPESLYFSVQFVEDIVPLRILTNLVIDDLGRPVVYGLLSLLNDLIDGRVYRFTANGAKDPSFGFNQRGVVDIDHEVALPGIGESEDWPVEIAVTRNRIVVASRAQRPTTTFAFVTTTLESGALFSNGFE